MPDGRVEDDRCPATIARDDCRLDLRILATTDMHMNLLPYDYFANRPSETGGLGCIATLIARRRQEVPNCLLLDNGDFLQGAPIGDLLAATARSSPRQPSPVIAAMNALRYDAAALGNHDFSFGLHYLRAMAAQAGFPLLAANLRLHRGPQFPGHTILRRIFTDRHGHRAELAIGVFGLLPPQTADWDCDLSDLLACDDMIDSARRLVPAIRAEGADIVIALAHSGIGRAIAVPGMENGATALAGIEGVDVVIAGHTHQVFPGPGIVAAPGIDPVAGTLAGKPAVMAGFGGTHLGIIDLQLHRKDGGRWQAAAFRTRAEPVGPDIPAAPAVTRPVMAAHRQTLRQLRCRVGRSLSPLNSYFALIGHDCGLRLVNLAQRWHVRRQLRDSKWAGLPILSASAPFRAGGRGGPHHYTDVPAGPLTLRNLADLYSFPNRIGAICLTGEQISDWLERSASLFRRILPGEQDRPLIDPGFPNYHFDVIDGVSWRIDLSVPPRFAPDGRLIAPGSHRISELRRHGRPVDPGELFVLATNSYRLAGCGLFSNLVLDSEIALKGRDLSRDILRNYIRRRRRIRIDPSPQWQFLPMPGSTVLFDSGPGALPHLPGIWEHFQMPIEHLGQTADGFARFRLSLGPRGNA